MPRILLVDDEPNICLLVSAELEDEEYEVICAGDLGSADKLLAQESFDLLILDIRLSRENGLELLHRLRRNQGRTLPVILFSAYSAYRHDMAAWQADAYVEKSSDLTQLKLEAANLLSRHRLEEENR